MIETLLNHLQTVEGGTSPKYHVLRDAIRAAITSGDWPRGSRLPTEAEMSRTLPFSLGTVQKAYGELVREGVVERARGRGSFVAEPGHEMAEPWHSRFIDQDGTVMPVFPRLLGHATPPPDPRWASFFGLGAEVVVIDRLLSIAHRFAVLSRFFVPGERAAALLGLPPVDVERANFKTVLLQRSGIRIARIVQTVAAADEDTWRRFKLSGQPHIRLEATALDEAGSAIYFQQLYVPRDARPMLFESDLRSR